MIKIETVLVAILICLFTFASVMAGRLYESFSTLEKIAAIAEKHKQRFYDEGYERGKAEMTGILVGTEPTRDYSNYSDPCMLAQGASIDSYPYERGFNDALDAIILLDLELSLGAERKTFGEMSDICRERFGVAK